MAKWNLVAMGQVGLSGWTGKATRPLALAITRPDRAVRVTDPGAYRRQVLRDDANYFLREVDAVIAAGRRSRPDRPLAPGDGPGTPG